MRRSGDVLDSVLFSVNGQTTTIRSSHTSGHATRTVEPLYFCNLTTRTVMPRFRVTSTKDIICKAAAYMKVKFHGTNLPTDELNNFITEMFLFYKDNLTIENVLGNKQVFKATLHLDIIIPKMLKTLSKVFVIMTTKL